MAISRFSNSTIANGFPKYQSTKFNLPVTSNLGYWLDATDAATLTLSGSEVSQWNDKSGNGVNFTQGTSANRPTLYTDPVTSNQFIRFDGSNDSMSVTNNFWEGKTAFTIFWVFKWNSGSTTDYEPIMTTTNTGLSNDNGSFHYINPSDNGASYPLYSSNANNNYESSNSYTSGKTYIMEAFDSGSTYYIYRNSSFEGSLAMSTTPGATANAVILLAYQVSPLRYAKFDIGEILVYSTALSDSDRTLVRNYLNTKWRAF